MEKARNMKLEKIEMSSKVKAGQECMGQLQDIILVHTFPKMTYHWKQWKNFNT